MKRLMMTRAFADSRLANADAFQKVMNSKNSTADSEVGNNNNDTRRDNMGNNNRQDNDNSNTDAACHTDHR